MLTNLKIGLRIAIALIVPTLGMLVFSGLLLVDRNDVISKVSDLRSLVALGPTVSALVHEMQKERGMSAGFIGSKGKKFSDALSPQRKTTNEKKNAAVRALEGFDTAQYGASLQGKFKTALQAVAQLDESRNAVNGFKFTVAQMAKYYSGTIAKLLSVVEETAVLSTDAQMTSLIVTYTSFLQAKERSGIERAMGAGGFGTGKFSPAIHKRFVELIAQQESFMGIFQIYGTPDIKAHYVATVKGLAVDEVARMRKIAIASPQTNDIGGVDATHWFKQITNKINLLKQVEDKIAIKINTLGAEIEGEATNQFYTILVVSLALLSLAIALSIVIVRGITGPLSSMTAVMGVLAAGDKTVKVPGIGRGDEIGTMADAVEVFKINMIKAEELAEQEKRAIIRRERRAKAIEGLLTKFNNEVSEALQIVSTAATEMEATSKAMSENAEHTSEQATTVAAASEEAATNVETVAAAAEELGASVNEINRQVTESENITSQAKEEGIKTNEMVNGLSDSVGKIGDVVSLINDIADQTNLLALNATIEAARAGDAGKGFAVVASEVKNLANQTGKATEEIGKQIREVQEVTASSVEAISKVTDIVDKMSEISSAIAAAIEEQGSAVQEIARNVQQAAEGTKDVNLNISGVSTAASETGASAVEVLSTAQSVSERSTLLREQVDTFLTNVKTA